MFVYIHAKVPLGSCSVTTSMGSKVPTKIYEIALNIHMNNPTFRQQSAKAMAYQMLAM
jgi:hypothetical protein